MGNFAHALAFGQVGESLISRWLQSRGHLVFPAYEKEISTGKGPQLFSAAGSYVLPDLLVFRRDGVCWIEAKHKSCFTWHRRTGAWTTGIDLRHYAEYQQVAARTGTPCWILFWHPSNRPHQRDIQAGSPAHCPTGLFGGDLATLVKRENHRSPSFDASRDGVIGHGRSGMVYWAVDDLKLLAGPSDILSAAA